MACELHSNSMLLRQPRRFDYVAVTSRLFENHRSSLRHRNCARILALWHSVGSSGNHQRPHFCTRVLAAADNDEPSSTAGPPEMPQSVEAQAPRDDDVLPDNLSGALAQGSAATQRAMQSGASRCLVELLLPELWDPNSGAVFAEEGDQQRFWKLTRRFVDELVRLSDLRIRVLYPDTGVAAMLRAQWTDANFVIGSLNDRVPFREEDEIIVLAAPDPQGLASCKAIASSAAEQGKPVILFNPRLASGDVGIGLNVRRMRDEFLSTFTTTYALCPIGDMGTVFRCYPALWQVFVEDPAAPGRYCLAAEHPSRPAGEALDMILMESSRGDLAEGEQGSTVGIVGQVQATIAGMQRFMKQLQN